MAEVTKKSITIYWHSKYYRGRISEVMVKARLKRMLVTAGASILKKKSTLNL